MTIPSAETDAWNCAEGVQKGNPSLLRYRPALRPHLGDDRFPRLLQIEWQFDDSNSSGMPSSEQSDEMRAFEDAIVGALDPDRLAILAFVHTNSCVREWNLYVGETATVQERVNSALSSFPRLPITLRVTDDPDWAELRSVYDLCK